MCTACRGSIGSDHAKEVICNFTALLTHQEVCTLRIDGVKAILVPYIFSILETINKNNQIYLFGTGQAGVKFLNFTTPLLAARGKTTFIWAQVQKRAIKMYPVPFCCSTTPKQDFFHPFALLLISDTLGPSCWLGTCTDDHRQG